jgi:capsular exopolysaccharide synthesis family protein
MSTATHSRPARPVPRDPRGGGHGPARPAHRQIDPFRVIRRYLLLIIASAIIGTGVGVGAYAACREFYPLYSGEVLFEIRPGVRDVKDIGTADMVADQLVTRLGNSEAVLLTSRDVLETALRDPIVRRTQWFQKNFVTGEGVELIERAVDQLVEDLQTGVRRNTNLFHLSWSTHHPADIPVILNTIARTYMEKRRSLDDEIYGANIGTFRGQLQTTQREIEDADQEMQAFIRAEGLGTLQDPRDSQVAFRMRQLTQQITMASGELSMAQSGYLQVSRKLEGTVEPTFDDRLLAEQDPSVALATSQIQQLKTDLRTHLENRKPDDTLITRLESRLRATEATREAKIQEIIRRNLEAQLKSLGDQVEQLQSTLDQTTEEYEAKGIILQDLAADQTKVQALMTQREYLAEQRDADLQLIKEVQLMRLRADAARVNLSIPAREPRERSFPKIEMIVPLGTLLVMSLTVGLIFLRELTDQRIKSMSDVAMLPGASVLGMIPDYSDDPTRVRRAELVVQTHPHSVLAESYRQAFTAIVKRVDRAGHQSLLLMGGLPGSGTTTVATNLGTTWAAAGRSVALVDANFRRPRLPEAMGMEAAGPGLGDVLAGAVTLAEAIVDGENGVAVLPAGSPGNRTVEMLNTPQFDSLMAELRARYDMIIFDAPPAVVAGEAMVLANRVDAAVLVVRANQEHRGLVARLIMQLIDAHCDLLGVLLNRPRGTAGGYFKKNFATMAAYTSRQRK